MRKGFAGGSLCRTLHLECIVWKHHVFTKVMVRTMLQGTYVNKRIKRIVDDVNGTMLKELKDSQRKSNFQTHAVGYIVSV